MPKVLVVSLGTISDTIYTIPLLYVLKRAECDIHVLTSEKGYELINRNPLVNRVHLVPMEQWSKKMPYWGIFEDLKTVIKKIKKQNFDIVIDCERSLRSLFLVMFSGAKRRLSYSNANHFSSIWANEILSSQEGMHKLDINLNYAKHLGYDVSNAEFMLPEKNYNSKVKMDKFLSFSEEKPMLVLCPNYSETEFSWSPKNWINFVCNISENYNVVIVGTQKDNVLAQKMAHKNLINLCGKVNIDDLRYVFSLADKVISDKLEYSLLAWANKTSNIVHISTSFSPNLDAPFGYGCNVINMVGNLSCQPCNSSRCKNGTYKCVHVPFVEDLLKVL